MKQFYINLFLNVKFQFANYFAISELVSLLRHYRHGNICSLQGPKFVFHTLSSSWEIGRRHLAFLQSRKLKTKYNPK